jgi:hypothetical protein
VATTVRIRDEDKSALDALRAKLARAGAGEVPVEEILHRIILLAQAHERELLREEEDRAPPLSAEDVTYYLSLPSDFGIETDESTIDADLYADPRRE